MKTVQMTLDEKLVRQVDALAKKLRTTRSAFTREMLRSAIKRQKIAELAAATSTRIRIASGAGGGISARGRPSRIGGTYGTEDN